MRKGLLFAGCVAASAVLALATSGCARAATAAPSAAAVRATASPCTATATAAYAAEITDAGKVAWQVSLPPGQAQALPSPVFSKGVAVLADNADLVGLRAADGHRLWDDHLRPNGKMPADLGGLWQWNGSAIALITYSATDWRLVAVNPADGKVRWQFKFRTAVDSWSGVSPDGVLALTAGEELYVLNLANGRAIWSRAFVKLANHASYAAELLITDGVLVADYLQLAPPAPSVLVGYSEKTGHQLWARTGLPALSSMEADGGVMFISGVDYQGKQVPTPLTDLSAASGKTLWHAAVGYVYALWTAPGQVVFGSQSGMYDVNPATGAKRWKVPGEASAPALSSGLLLTATDVAYYPNGGDLTDRRLSDGTVAWRQPGVPVGGGSTFLVAPSGPNALIADGNDWDDPPQTVVSAVNLGTGKLVATVKLPSDLPAGPAVTGSDAIYELNPEPCVSIGLAGQGTNKS
jgi:outer membrane protein assembly factor BamB